MNMSTTKTTRRQLLAQISAVAVAGGAVMTTTAAMPIGADPDAELIAAGEELIALFRRDRELWDFLAPFSEHLQGHMHDAAHEVMKVRESGDSKAADELWAVRTAEIKQAREALGPEFLAASEEQERVQNSLDEPARRMFALPARTVHGLAIKALCAAHERSELWDEPFNDLDWTDNFVRDVIEAVLAFAGEPLPFAAPDATERVVASPTRIAEVDPIR
jgi:hypothetical protein